MCGPYPTQQKDPSPEPADSRVPRCLVSSLSYNPWSLLGQCKPGTVWASLPSCSASAVMLARARPSTEQGIPR